jgi:Do/DeqQ family serine protease
MTRVAHLTCSLVLLPLFASTVAAAPERRTAVVGAVERVSPAVVSVRVKTLVSTPTRDPFSWFFRDFTVPRQRVEASQGSGVIIDRRGYVLTNYHVIAAGGDVEVELVSGEQLTAEVVGTAPEHDLAVLQVRSEVRLPFVAMGSSHDLMIGETVIAIGNPFGLSHTVTTGVVSALHRFIRTDERVYTDFVQTDASINPGNSGGPLLNIRGELVGVNTAIYGKARGIGFAIPIDKARRIVGDLVRHGEVRRPYFGLEVQELTPQLARAFGVSDRVGVLVADVEPDGPVAGRLREGDIIVEIGGARVKNRDELRAHLGHYTVGARISMVVLRDRARKRVTITAAALEPEEALRLVRDRIGMAVVELPREEARRYGLPAGVILAESVRPSSPAGRVGIRRGDWIRAVNSEKLLGTREFSKAIARSYWRGRVTLLVQRGRAWQQIAFEY